MDSWSAYTTEKAAILDALATVPNVVILSGDRHEFALVEFNHFSSTGWPIFEVSTSPLSMFYIPFVRTLLPVSVETIPRKHVHSVVRKDGYEAPAESVEKIPRERVLKYLPIGNYKWSTIEVDTSNSESPIARLEVVIDGKVGFRHTIKGFSTPQSTMQS